jgi:hypothetical protein
MGNLRFYISIPKPLAPFSLSLSYRPHSCVTRIVLGYSSVVSYFANLQMVLFWTQNWHLYKYDTIQVSVETEE